MPKPIDLAVTEAGKVPVEGSRAATSPHPRLVNRGAAGLLHKTKDLGVTPTQVLQAPRDAPINRIADDLLPLAKPIEQFVSDPDNARVHPERNMEAIRESLRLYGQVKPIVVRRENNVVVAGNGTLQAARELGWTEIAATIVEMNEVEAAGYGLADNRTAELAKWDFETVARLDRLLLEAQHPTVGWSTDELEVLRAADWVQPAPTDATFGGQPGGDAPLGDSLLVGFTPDEFEPISAALANYREKHGNGELTQAQCISGICLEWVSEYQRNKNNATILKDAREHVNHAEGGRTNGSTAKPRPKPKSVA
jgi:hypothetical protein